MTIEERADLAANLKATGQCNCTQSVLKAFEDKIDIAPEELSKLAAGFAAGMGCMESTCGALIGAVMTAGMITEGKGTPRYSKEMVAKFNEKCGATICKDLKGITTGQVLCECPECVRNAVLVLGETVAVDHEIEAPSSAITREGAMQAFLDIRNQSKANGMSDMSLEEINEEIKLTRI